MNLGISRGQVRLLEYQIEWKNEFNSIKSEILNHTSLNPNQIEHVGSTSIPGLKAKPIIDILIGVENYKSVSEDFFDSLKNIGIYRIRFQKEDEVVLAKFKDNSFQEHTHFVHLVNIDGTKWNDLIKFRNYLIHNKHAREKYMSLKEKLASEYPVDRPKYTEEKETFIKNILKISESES